MDFPRIASTVYYTGAGAVLLGTTIRFFYRLYRDRDRKDAFVEQMEETHLPYIYKALRLIARKLDIDIDTPSQ